MLTERSIINFLIWTGGLILGPYLAASTVSFNFVPLMVVAAVCILVFIFGYLRDRMCLLPLIGTFIPGHLNFLPLKLAPAEMCAATVLAYYLIAYVTLQRKKMQTGPRCFFIPILITAGLILYHEHDFGLRSMGGEKEGARGALFILVAAVVYVFGVSINSPPPSFFSKTPVICVAVTFIFTIPYVVTTYVPSTAPYFFIITDDINGSAYSSSVLDDSGIVRNQGQAMLGSAAMVCLLAYFPFYTWWRPHRWWMAFVALICVALVVMGGFRSGLAAFGLAVLLATWCYLGWRTLLLVPPAALAIFILVAAQDGHLLKLPTAAQRTLSFLPGDWDAEVVEAANSSNNFRDKIRETYLREEADKSPLLGNGLSFDAAEFDRYTNLAKTQETIDGYYQSKEFVIGKMFHTGWISLYDSVGLIGFATFVFFAGSLVWLTGKMVFRRVVDRKSPLFPLKVWLFANISSSLVSYFTVFGDIKLAFPLFCYYAIAFTHLDRLERLGYRGDVPVREIPFDSSRTQLPATV